MTGAKQRKKTSCCQDGDSNCAHNAYSFFIIVNGHGDGEGKGEGDVLLSYHGEKTISTN